MDTEFWVKVLIAAVAIVGTLLGAAMTNIFNARRDETARKHQELLEAATRRRQARARCLEDVEAFVRASSDLLTFVQMHDTDAERGVLTQKPRPPDFTTLLEAVGEHGNLAVIALGALGEQDTGRLMVEIGGLIEQSMEQAGRGEMEAELSAAFILNLTNIREAVLRISSE